MHNTHKKLSTTVGKYDNVYVELAAFLHCDKDCFVMECILRDWQRCLTYGLCYYLR
jgi:hypothetical protein